MSRTSVRSRAALVAAGLVVIVASLTGCSNAPADLDNATASRLQTGVFDVSTQAAGGDFAAAQSALGDVQGDLLAAAAAGTVSGARAARIQSAINLVGADLSAAIEASKPTPAPAPAVTVEAPPPADAGNAGDTGNNGNGKGNGKDKSDKCKKKDDC
ncbi:mucin-associated surface protein [Glaciibacter sp. 2TAF33]|uniref:mucin-associated surface protein n=1 Tax=Glaciibacter sp. 2TAF33 TaxID=3233015 RepID=UPI003F91D08B